MSPASTAPDHNSSLLERLLTQQSDAWRRGQRLPVEMLLADHPALADDPEALLDLLSKEKLLRAAAGETPQLVEYQQRFPHLADQLRKHFEVEVPGGADTLSPAEPDGANTASPIPAPTMSAPPEI